MLFSVPEAFMRWSLLLTISTLGATAFGPQGIVFLRSTPTDDKSSAVPLGESPSVQGNVLASLLIPSMFALLLFAHSAYTINAYVNAWLDSGEGDTCSEGTPQSDVTHTRILANS